MPKTAAKMASNRTTRRFLKQSATNWSIIEPHRTPYHYALARPESGFYGGGCPLLIGNFDVAAFECPFGDFDEDARRVIGHDKCRGRYDEPRLRRRNECGIREHVRLHHLVGIGECDAYLVAPGIGVDHVADEQ